MRIGVVSDSHGNSRTLKQAIDAMGPVAVIFHLGDYVSDGESIKRMVDIPVITLRGNMDIGYEEGEDFVKTQFGGKTIIACHGHEFGVKGSLNTLFYKAKSEGADIVLYGHTHMPLVEKEEGILFMNPGALTYSHPGVDKSYGVLTIEDDVVNGEIHSVK
ncbi:MAG: metallophosphoesterase [Eubacterium aggregans]|uniref:Phosphoesterase n=1 Tax=Eubacterium aggregans TaxID=81409 RepID=A0A1H4B3Q7_9FIRM|nr:metallophosphoesterase [Eubacterium aggregans]MDD4690675.1 metallophosphoesterase [Eubacterium aggregans]MEA5073449.1 metallophosphoesterase [Eubacterium aggregans]SEA42731.1 hypothetical protein SAMN04515656_11019 [Eubacterium aggregans]